MKLTSEKFKGHLFASITIIVWGTTFIASKLLLKEFTPIQVMIMRFLIAYVTLLLLNHKIVKSTWKEELTFFFLAVTGTTIYFLLENQALTISFASNVSIILSAAPILTAMLAHVFTKDEKINEKTIIGSFVAFVGVALVVLNGTFMLKLSPLGDIMSLGAALSWAIYSVLLKKHVSNYDSIYLTRRVVFYSILTTLPMLLMEGKPFAIKELWNPTFIFCLLFLGVLGSGICYVAWNVASKFLGIVATNNYIYLGPFITMVVAGIILNEKITIMGVLGALLIVIGVVIAAMKNEANSKNIDELEFE